MTAPKTTPRPSDEALRKALTTWFANRFSPIPWCADAHALAMLSRSDSPLRPILDANDALHRRIGKLEGERDEFADMCTRFSQERAPEGMETLAKDRDIWWKRATAAEARAARDAAEIERLRAAFRNADYLSSRYQRLWRGGIVRDLPEAEAAHEKSRQALLTKDTPDAP